jgi:predicted RNA-binding protein associated with RNAse of E/G family
VIESPVLVDQPHRVANRVIAARGYSAIWFVYRRRWYDVGKFYDAQKRWIGYYCDIIKPVNKLLTNTSRTVTLTDLFLDLWMTKEHQVFVLDREELDEAVQNHSISGALAKRAETEIDSLQRKVRAGSFPPIECKEWTL